MKFALRLLICFGFVALSIKARAESKFICDKNEKVTLQDALSKGEENFFKKPDYKNEKDKPLFEFVNTPSDLQNKFEVKMIKSGHYYFLKKKNTNNQRTSWVVYNCKEMSKQLDTKSCSVYNEGFSSLFTARKSEISFQPLLNADGNNTMIFKGSGSDNTFKEYIVRLDNKGYGFESRFDQNKMKQSLECSFNGEQAAPSQKSKPKDSKASN